MRVLLVQPTDSVGNYAPKRPLLAQAYLGAALDKAGHEVKIMDLRSKRAAKRFDKEVKNFNAQVICLSLASLTLKNGFEIMEKAKEQNPDAIVIAGGPEVTSLAKDILPKSQVDFIIVGEKHG